MLNEHDLVPGLEEGELLDTLTTAGTSLVAWDTWDDDPGRAAGATVANVVLAVVGTKGATAGLRAGTGGATAEALLTLSEVAGRELAGAPDVRVEALRGVAAPDLGVEEVRTATPLNDGTLPKSDPAVGAQITQIRHDIAPMLQKQADAAWQAALDRCEREDKEATPQRLGSYAHTELSKWITQNVEVLADQWSGYRVRPEISFDSRGFQAQSGAPGSLRPDIVLERQTVNARTGRPAGWQVVHVYDLKTGKAGISRFWANRVTNALHPLVKPEELRPSARAR